MDMEYKLYDESFLNQTSTTLACSTATGPVISATEPSRLRHNVAGLSDEWVNFIDVQNAATTTLVHSIH